MKINIITFHRSLNYGAFLQAYALQEFLKMHSYEVQFIDITREINFVGKKWNKIIGFDKLLNFYYNFIYRLKQFFFYNYKDINCYLHLTRYYRTVEDLLSNPPISDVYITGSDQVWNPDYLIKKDKYDFTNAYFLNFGSKHTKRIAYAASFGKLQFDNDYISRIIPHLITFSFIGVREKAMVDIFKQYHIQTEWVCDPTLLHCELFYKKLLTTNKPDSNKLFCYNIRIHIPSALKKEATKNGFQFHQVRLKKHIHLPSFIEWLSLIHNSGFIVTDSFHCVVFCLIFNKPFIALAAKKSLAGMNNRLESLLCSVGLQDHLISDYNYDANIIKFFLNKKIHWDNVGKKIKYFRELSSKLLLDALTKSTIQKSETIISASSQIST